MLAGAYAKEEVCRTLVVLVSNESSLHAYSARQAARALQATQEDASLLLLTTAAWFIGVSFSPPCGGSLPFPSHLLISMSSMSAVSSSLTVVTHALNRKHVQSCQCWSDASLYS